jgi:hypothetical protein
VTEAELCAGVLEMLDLFGWTAVHHRPGRTRGGSWRTPLQGRSAPGWPDIFAVRRERALAAELKSERGVLTDAQRRWLDDLGGAGVETYVWRPALWVDGTIEALLRAQTPRPA